jgi:flagellar export protein FliJ
MSRRFRLATLERLRASRLDDAGAGLQRAADALETAQRRRDDLTRALRQDRAPQAATPSEVSTHALHRDRLRDERARAVIEVDACAESLAAARQAWLQARAELRAVRSLHDRHRQELAAEDDRREQRAADEVAGNAAARRLGQAGPDAGQRAGAGER